MSDPFLAFELLPMFSFALLLTSDEVKFCAELECIKDLIWSSTISGCYLSVAFSLKEAMVDFFFVFYIVR